MSILLGILVAVIALVAVAVIAPHDFDLRVDTRPSPTLVVSVRPFSGRMRSFTLVDTGHRRTGEDKAKSREKPRKARRKRRRPGIGLAREAVGLLARLVSAFHLIRLRIDLAFGLGNPADTGQLYGALAPLAYGFSGARGVDIALRPDFFDMVLSGEIDARLRVRLVALIIPTARFVLRNRVWQL